MYNVDPHSVFDTKPGEPFKKPRVWSGRHNKWVYASKVYRCPKCGDKWGGADAGFEAGGPYDRTSDPVGDRTCPACK
jgi:hypothetical protein